jgi:FkbM family methyltransferase
MGLGTLVLPAHWLTRPNTWDLNMWDAVVVHDEYGLRQREFSLRDTCIDVGAHIGCFSWLAYDRGFGHVYAYEADKGNFDLLQHNVQPYPITAVHGAVWRSDRDETLYLHHSDDPVNTGGHSVVGGGKEGGDETVAIPFDEIVLVAAAASMTKRVRFVKMDCEGSEFPILYTSQTLDLIDEIAGEYHQWATPPESLADLTFSIDALAEFLRGKGFHVEHRPSNSTLGLFHATR